MLPFPTDYLYIVLLDTENKVKLFVISAVYFLFVLDTAACVFVSHAGWYFGAEHGAFCSGIRACVREYALTLAYLHFQCVSLEDYVPSCVMK